MHASCAICGDVFTGLHPEIIHSTHCGHVFHYECLLEWLQRSKTCPHCRAKVSESSTIRLYFQLNGGLGQDTGVLENKIQSLTFQLSVREADFKKLVDEAKKYKDQNKALRHSVINAEKNSRNHETVVSSLQDQIKLLKYQMKSGEEAKLKVEELEAKLEQYKSIEKVLKGSITDTAETLELMKDITDTGVLCACINTLKREMYTLRENSRDFQNNLKAKDSKMLQMNNEITGLQEKLSILSRSLEKVKDELKITETENRDLRLKCDRLRNNIRNVGSTEEMVCSNTRDISTMQSPAPSKPRMSLDLNYSLENEFTPSPLKAKFSFNNKKPNKLLLNKPRLQQCRSFSGITSDTPDGFGGHGKQDDFLSLENKFPLFRPDKLKKLPLKQPPSKKPKPNSPADTNQNIAVFFAKQETNS